MNKLNTHNSAIAIITTIDYSYYYLPHLRGKENKAQRG